jgi:hypothetical protein
MLSHRYSSSSLPDNGLSKQGRDGVRTLRQKIGQFQLKIRLGDAEKKR